MTARVRCLGCGQVGPWGRSGRCPLHRLALQRTTERDPKRRAIKRRRYDSTHRADRRAWAPHVEAGLVDCARCTLAGVTGLDARIEPGTPWDLDHVAEWQRSHPSHARHNRGARRTTPGGQPE